MTFKHVLASAHDNRLLSYSKVLIRTTAPLMISGYMVINGEVVVAKSSRCKRNKIDR